MRIDGEKIRQIILSHNEGTAHREIAQHLKVDVSTVRYHVEKIERVYGTTIGVYAVVQPKRACEHPSLKCFLCDQLQDNIRRRELEIINQLTFSLKRANEILVREGYEPLQVTGV